MQDAHPPTPPPNWASGFMCPRCGGAIWERDDSAWTLFECRIGDRFSEAELWIEHSITRDQALLTAARVLAENGALARRIAASAQARAERLVHREAATMLMATIERYAREPDERRCAHALVGFGPVTIGHGASLGFDDAIGTPLADPDFRMRRYVRGASIDLAHERLIWADVSLPHWIAECRQTVAEAVATTASSDDAELRMGRS